MGFTKGKFGTSAVRARWRLIRVMISMWIIICISGVLCYIALGTPLWLLPQLYGVGLCVFHAWHWAAHQRRLLYPMWKVHMYHHWHVYPPKRFLSRVYKNDKKGRTNLGSVLHDGPLYLGIIANIWALWHFQLLTKPADVLVSVLTNAWVGSFSNWLHHTFHIEGHWIERFVYFHDLRALHYTHHQGTAKQNYGFLDFSGDLAGGTTMAADYSLSNKMKKDGEEVGDLSSASLGDGSEHRSTVAPGELPGILRDGFKECAFCAFCFVIWLLIGAQGALFGAPRYRGGDNPDKKVAQTDELGQPSDSNLTSVWTDFFLFS